MAISIDPIICPQCGSPNVRLTNDEQGICDSCGVTFVIQSSNEQSDEDFSQADVSIKPEDYIEIVPTKTECDFLRALWIFLAKEDAPLTVFEHDFEKVVHLDHQIFQNTCSIDMDYHASIGYDREEPYIDYETYEEEAPDHIETETYKDVYRQERQRQVIKYKTVQKQRQVTKYRTVTDWNILSDKYTTKSTVTIECNPAIDLSEYRFLSEISDTPENAFRSASLEQIRKFRLTPTVQKQATREHGKNMFDHLCNDLPGDRHKDVDFNITNVSCVSTTIYFAKEFLTTILFEGQEYSYIAFPFGKMEVIGGRIENKNSLENIIQSKRNDLLIKKEKRKSEIDKAVSKKTNKISVITIIALLISIAISFFIRSKVLIWIAFITAAVLFVYNTLRVKIETQEATKTADEDIAEITKDAETEISDYSSNYMKHKLDLLNKKLRSLGCEPAEIDDL